MLDKDYINWKEIQKGTLVDVKDDDDNWRTCEFFAYEPILECPFVVYGCDKRRLLEYKQARISIMGADNENKENCTSF